jgi:DNA-binding IclR family transcriptional regulator
MSVSGEAVRVIDRSVDLLDALAEGPRSLTEICRGTSLSKGTAMRLLGGLGAHGMVVKDPVGGRYMLGPGLLTLVDGALSGIGAVATVGRLALRQLAEETGDTVALHVQSGLERICVEEIPSSHSIRYSSLVGAVAPVENGASGVVLLAFSPNERQAQTVEMLAASRDAFDPAALEAKLVRARHDGWAISTGERVPGATSISIPVPSRVLLLALSVLGPEDRLPPSTLKSFLPAMRRTAEHLVDVLDVQSPTRDRAS